MFKIEVDNSRLGRGRLRLETRGRSIWLELSEDDGWTLEQFINRAISSVLQEEADKYYDLSED